MERKLNSIFLCMQCSQVIEVIRHPHDKAESKYNPEAVSKEDEERYQKMLCENEELQRLIVQVRTNRYPLYYFNHFHQRIKNHSLGVQCTCIN